MRHIIVFGSIPLATWVLKQLLTDQDRINLVGVVCEPGHFAHHGLQEIGAHEFAQQNDIPIFDLSEAEQFARTHDQVLGLSVRFHKLLKQSLIDTFDQGVINLHGGSLPRFRGTNIANHMILEHASEGAGTIHFLDQGIDTGDVVIRKSFTVDHSDTSHDLFMKTLDALKLAFLELRPHLLDGKIPRTPQDDLIAKGEVARTYFKKDLAEKKKLSFAMSPQQIETIARAFYFPGHEPAFFEFEGRKLYVTPKF